MLRAKSDERVHRREPLRDRLLRQPHHQVQRDVVEAGVPGHFERVARPGRGMQPAETLKLLVAKRLDTKTEAIDARVAKRPQPVAGDRLGVRLEGDLSDRREMKGPPARADDALYLGGLEQRRGTASEKNRIRR
jgi:hypothetical protein